MTSTIYDVAEKAGVSISTVSRVLNRNANVHERTKQKILKVIADLNFGGVIAHEYTPTRDALASLAQAVEIFTV